MNGERIIGKKIIIQTHQKIPKKIYLSTDFCFSPTINYVPTREILVMDLFLLTYSGSSVMQLTMTNDITPIMYSSNFHTGPEVKIMGRS